MWRPHCLTVGCRIMICVKEVVAAAGQPRQALTDIDLHYMTLHYCDVHEI